LENRERGCISLGMGGSGFEQERFVVNLKEQYLGLDRQSDPFGDLISGKKSSGWGPFVHWRKT
jgi:hypothetical protein